MDFPPILVLDSQGQLLRLAVGMKNLVPRVPCPQPALTILRPNVNQCRTLIGGLINPANETTTMKPEMSAALAILAPRLRPRMNPRSGVEGTRVKGLPGRL